MLYFFFLLEGCDAASVESATSSTLHNATAGQSNVNLKPTIDVNRVV